MQRLYRLLFVYLFVCVGHAAHKIDELWQQISRIEGFSGRDEIQQLDREALLYVTTQIGELWHWGSPWGAKILMGVKSS